MSPQTNGISERFDKATQAPQNGVWKIGEWLGGGRIWVKLLNNHQLKLVVVQLG